MEIKKGPSHAMVPFHFVFRSLWFDTAGGAMLNQSLRPA